MKKCPKRKNSKNAKLTKLRNSCKNIFKYFQAFSWIPQWNIEIQRLNRSLFKAFSMTNLQYEIGIPQKIYNRATITEKVYYKNYWNRLWFILNLCFSLHKYVLQKAKFCYGQHQTTTCYFFFVFEENYNDRIKTSSKSKWTGHMNAKSLIFTNT